MAAVGYDLRRQAREKVRAFQQARIAVSRPPRNGAHGAVQMGDVRIPVLHGGQHLLVGGVAMAHGGQDPRLPKGAAKGQCAGKLRCGAPPPDHPLSPAQQGAIVPRIRTAKVPGILRALLVPGKVGPLQVQAQQGRAAGAAGAHPFIAGKKRLHLLIAGGQAGGHQRGRPVAGMGLRRAAEGLCRTVHKVMAASAMGMQIDKARRHIPACRLQQAAVPVACRVPGAGRFDYTVLDHQLPILQDAVGGNQPPIYDLCPHVTSSFRSARSMAVIAAIRLRFSPSSIRSLCITRLKVCRLEK